MIQHSGGIIERMRQILDEGAVLHTVKATKVKDTHRRYILSAGHHGQLCDLLKKLGEVLQAERATHLQEVHSLRSEIELTRQQEADYQAAQQLIKDLRSTENRIADALASLDDQDRAS